MSFPEVLQTNNIQNRSFLPPQKMKEEVDPFDYFAAFRDVEAPGSDYTQLHSPLIGSKFLYTQREILVYMREEATRIKQSSPQQAQLMDKIIDRANRNLKKLDGGEAVRIPEYYHATKQMSAVVSIIQDRIRASMGIEGPGVYLSTEIEPKYGDFIFALDRRDIENQSLSKVSGVNQNKIWFESDSTKAVWRALEDDYLMNDKGVIKAAYLILRKPEDLKALDEELKAKNLQNKIEIVSQEEGMVEMKMVQDLEGVYEPKSWSQLWSGGQESLSFAIPVFEDKYDVSDEENSSDWD